MILFDTDVVIDLVRGSASAKAFLLGLASEPLRITAPVAMEFLIGSRDKLELQRALRALTAFHVVAASSEDSHLAVQLVQRHCLSSGLSFADFLIAAQALNLKSTLYTFNIKHYKAIPGLDAQAPYQR